MPFVTDDERKQVWDAIPQAKSFRRSVQIPKLGRWFSWNECARDQLPEYHILKMLLEFHLEDATEDSVPFTALKEAAEAKTPQEQLSRLRSAVGGLRLCHAVMTDGLLVFAKILYVVSKATWTWYASEVQSVQSPQDNVRRLLQGARDKWLQEPHFAKTIQDSLMDASNLAYMGLPGGVAGPAANETAGHIFELTVNLLSHRLTCSLSLTCLFQMLVILALLCAVRLGTLAGVSVSMFVRCQCFFSMFIQPVSR